MSNAMNFIDVAKPQVMVNTNIEASYTPRKMIVKDKNGKWVSIVKKEGKRLELSIWEKNESGELEEVFSDKLNSVMDLINLDISDEIKSGISIALANWDKEIRKQEALIALSNVTVIPDRVTDKELLAYEIAQELIRRYNAVSVFYETPRGKTFAGVFCYEEGIYRPCEDWLKSQYSQFLAKLQICRANKSVVDEVVKNKIPALNPVVVSFETVRPVIAFENGLFDWETFILSGDFERSIKPFDKNVFVQHRIPHKLNTELVKRSRTGLERYIPPKTCEELLMILRTLSPKTFELLKSWAWYENVVEELLRSRMCFLLEMIGRSLLPGYRLFGDIVFKDVFVLLGPTNSGKSTFIVSLLGNTVLGEKNYAISKLSSFTTDDDEDIRRVFGTLFNVLAVFLPDVSKKERVDNWSYIRSVSGGDPVEARRLRENIFWYYPAYKIYIASNDPPAITESGEAKEALLNRFKVIEFRNRFGDGSLNLKTHLGEEDTEVLILCSLYALRLAYHRKSYSYTGIRDVEDMWLRYSEPIYRTVMEMIEKGVLALDPSLEITSNDLYNIVNDYIKEEVKRELGEEASDDIVEEVSLKLPSDQAAFTKKLKELMKRYGVKVLNRSGKRIFKGIGTPRKSITLFKEVHPHG